MHLAKIPAKRFNKYLLNSSHLNLRLVEFLLAFNVFNKSTYKDLYTTLIWLIMYFFLKLQNEEATSFKTILKPSKTFC